MILFLIVGILAVIGITYWAGTALMYQKQKRVIAAIQSADTVRLEEFSSKETLTVRELTINQRADLVKAMPYYVIFPLSLKLCFVPHHRILAVTPNVSTNVVLICFTCDQARYEESHTLFNMPQEWSRNLRAVFRENGVPIREDY